MPLELLLLELRPLELGQRGQELMPLELLLLELRPLELR
jgi:hypothetical protein